MENGSEKGTIDQKLKIRKNRIRKWRVIIRSEEENDRLQWDLDQWARKEGGWEEENQNELVMMMMIQARLNATVLLLLERLEGKNGFQVHLDALAKNCRSVEPWSWRGKRFSVEEGFWVAYFETTESTSGSGL